MTFDQMFETATGHPPFPFQREFAGAPALPNVLEAPTGAGKTATAVLGWLWRRRFASDEVRGATPRRLVFCLPMRSLVSQTAGAAAGWLENLGLDGDVSVHQLLGGAVDNSFDERPEHDAILVGTQDQLLSRALNRGYAVSRYRWPMQYALLNNDCLWVMDEIQLMGVGLSTTSQLAALREQWDTCGPQASVWMSATLDPRLLATVDATDRTIQAHPFTDADRQHPHLKSRLEAAKLLTLEADLYDSDDKVYMKALAGAVKAAHVPNTRTLVVLNRVGRAQELHAALAGEDAALLHSRFRPHDRKAIEDRVLRPDWTGILVATQAIEAGVDISSKTLFTELAPWSSLVQRFGRCNRTGEWTADDPAHIHVIDLPRPDDGLSDRAATKAAKDYEDLALPYSPGELNHARNLVEAHDDAAPSKLAKGLAEECEPAGPVVRRRDVYELFDTTPDLSGRDIDVARWVRDQSQPDVQLAWRSFDKKPAKSDAALHRDELCTVPLSQAEKFLKAALKKDRTACYRWDSLEGDWRQVQPSRIVPGQSYLLKCKAGGYDETRGWTGDQKDAPVAVPVPQIPQDDDAADRLTVGSSEFVHLEQHSVEARQECVTLEQRLAYQLPWEQIVEATHWHDLGKVHEAFQEMLVSALDGGDPLRNDGPWAKSDGRAGGHRCKRAHFRHELASALAMIELGKDDLSAYLAACHHGKVRMAIRSRPTEPRPQGPDRPFALGVYDGDILAGADLGEGVTTPEVTLKLDLMSLGSGERPSWSMRALGLLDTWGPFRLALMETLVRVADWRASALHAADEELTLA